MAPETLTVDDVIGGGNVVVSALLVAVAFALIYVAWRNHAPGSMIAGSFAILFLVLAALVSSLARYYTLGTWAPVSLLTLRIMALILLAGGTWTLAARAKRNGGT